MGLRVSPGKNAKTTRSAAATDIQQPRLGRRREPQRQEIQRVITEQPPTPTSHTSGGWRSAWTAPGRQSHVSGPTQAPTANVMAAS